MLKLCVSSCIEVILVLEILGIDAFSKLPNLKNERGSIQGKIICQ